MSMRLWVSNENPSPGDTITVCVTIEWMANASTDIEITNPVTNETINKGVDLDQDGHGCCTWLVPTSGWVTAEVSNYASDSIALVIS